MNALFSRRPSPALVVACIALFVALGPAAYATHEVINSSDVVDNSLLGVDVRGTAGTASTRAWNGALTGADISGQPANPAVGQPFVNGSLTGFDVADGSLRLADLAANSVDASKIVNDAGGADNVNATKLDGFDHAQLSPVGGDGRIADVALTTSDETVLTANITTAGSAWLLSSAALDLMGDGGNDDSVRCFLRFDGTSLSPAFRTQIPDSVFSSDATSLALVWAHFVGPGAHTVELQCSKGLSSASVTVDDAGLIVSGHLG